MRRVWSVVFSLALLLQLPALAADSGGTEPWTRTEGDGSYVTIRLAAGKDLKWSDSEYLAVRYADTGEPVPLSSNYYDGYLFATVPAEDADRPLEVFAGEPFDWTDLLSFSEPWGSNELQIRGILRGDEAGRLNRDGALTRAQAFAIMVRLLSLEPAGDPGYGDVSPLDWYYDTVSAARAAGIAAADADFRPNDKVTRAEFVVMVARAMETIGWLDPSEGDGMAEKLAQGSGEGVVPYALEEVEDADAIPDWALDAYYSLDDAANTMLYYVVSEQVEGMDEHNEPVGTLWLRPDQAITRGEAIQLVHGALDSLALYPSEAAIQLGFDRVMPVIDGSTSTEPYTYCLYYALFANYHRHPQYPESHSKSHESYERLIRGEVDVLFAATRASRELEAPAEEQGVELTYVPIAYDAMVFFTNAENSIRGLTRQQIQDIYVRNAYSNWNEVGGPDAALLPYCRNSDSGSHALMERYFLEDGALSLSPEILQGNVSQAMSSALTDVAQALSMNPPAYAIGYSTYDYYQSDQNLMILTDNRLHLLAVDGVLPTDETIADGSYPLSGYNYAVFRSDEPEDSPARRLAEFMRSGQGAEIVEHAGCLPVR